MKENSNRIIIQHFVLGIKGGKNRRRNRRRRTGIDQAAVWLLIVDYSSQQKTRQQNETVHCILK